MLFKAQKMTKEEVDDFMNDVINILKSQHVESKIETPGIEILHHMRAEGREAVSELLEESLTSMIDELEQNNSHSSKLPELLNALKELENKKKS